MRFARDKSADFDLPRELRPKNAYNLVRLLATATRWLREGAPIFEVEGRSRERLLAIKKGEVSLDEVLAEAEAMAPELERARDASTLAEAPRRRARRRPAAPQSARSSRDAGSPARPARSARTRRSPPEVVWSE